MKKPNRSIGRAFRKASRRSPGISGQLPAQAVHGRNIREMVHRIVTGFNPEQVYLFGSRARGTARNDSDVDLLVVMPVSGSKREKRLAIRGVLHDIPMALDVVVVTPREMESWKDIPATIPRVALREGKLLYARS